jgi:hypothetical protein
MKLIEDFDFPVPEAKPETLPDRDNPAVGSWWVVRLPMENGEVHVWLCRVDAVGENHVCGSVFHIGVPTLRQTSKQQFYRVLEIHKSRLMAPAPADYLPWDMRPVSEHAEPGTFGFGFVAGILVALLLGMLFVLFGNISIVP